MTERLSAGSALRYYSARSMAAVVQRLEREIVDLDVAGSIPASRPTSSSIFNT